MDTRHMSPTLTVSRVRTLDTCPRHSLSCMTLDTCRRGGEQVPSHLHMPRTLSADTLVSRLYTCISLRHCRPHATNATDCRTTALHCTYMSQPHNYTNEGTDRHKSRTHSAEQPSEKTWRCRSTHVPAPLPHNNEGTRAEGVDRHMSRRALPHQGTPT